MTNEFAVIMDSGGDPIFPEHKKHVVVPMNILFDGESYTYPGDLTREDVINALVNHKPGEIRTSQPSPKQVIAAVESIGAETVLYITLSSALSGTFNSAVIASRLLEKEGIRLVPFDSRSAGAGMGYLLAKALELRDSGKSLTEVVSELEKIRSHMYVRFALPTLDYLVAGGRLDPFRAAIAKLVGISPILWLNKDGAIDVEETVRVKDLWHHFVNSICDAAYLFVGPLAEKEFAAAKEELERQGKNILGVIDLSPVLLVHTGLNIVGEVHYDECNRGY